VAGNYLLARGPETEMQFLKTPLARLRVEGRDDGALLLSGAQDAVLLPRAGGYWRSDQAQLNAAYVFGQLHLDQLAYDSFPLWERPVLYAWLAALLGLSAAALILQPQRLGPMLRLGPRFVAYAGPGLVGAAFLLLATAVMLQRLAFTP